MQLDFLIPSKSNGKHNLIDVTDIVAASREGSTSLIQYHSAATGYLNFTTETMIVPDLAPVYAFMTDVFNETNIIKAEGYIGSILVESITTNRVIISVALGGTYFVENLNYNINTGKSVLTLIKI